MSKPVPEIRINILKALLDLTKRTNVARGQKRLFFTPKAVYERGRDGKYLTLRDNPIWGKHDVPAKIDEVETELRFLHMTDYAEPSFLVDGRSIITGYRINQDRISEVEKMVKGR